MSLNTTRSVGTKFFSANYEVRKAGPLDARLITPLHSELYDMNSIDFRYPGMIISVFGDTPELNGLWFNKNPATDSTTGLSVDDWIKLGSGSGGGGLMLIQLRRVRPRACTGQKSHWETEQA